MAIRALRLHRRSRVHLFRAAGRAGLTGSVIMATPSSSFVSPRTREPQYQFEVDMARRDGIARLGIMSNQRWRDDPRGLLFILSRYKFVAKMLSGKQRVVEIGCADAFGTRVVQQEVSSVTASDFDPVFIEDARSRMAAEGWACDT